MSRVLQWFGLQEAATPDAPAQSGELATAEWRVEQLTESLARLELANEDLGWQRLTNQYQGEFTREGLRRSAELCRIMAIANPMIKRGLSLRAAYIHGQGVGITARADGNEGTQDVNAVVQQFLDDDTNRAALTGHQAKLRLETAMGTDGNVFVALFTNPLDGRVTPRTLPFDEIMEKVTKPGDRMITHYYQRTWQEGLEEKKAYYPDIRYRPITRPKTHTDGVEIMWDSPVYHLNDNGLDGWTFGIGDAYAALPWARAYKDFLEDWVLLIKALSKIAFQTSSKSTPDSQRKRAALQNLANVPAGSAVNMSEGQKFEAVSKSGATIDSESGRPVLSMVAMALGLPVTTLSADPGQTGARAVAETLNLPTKLEMQGRQELWTEMFRAILGYVIDQAVIAPRGPLKGTMARDGDAVIVALAGDTDRTLEIVWPSLDELPIETLINAIVEADGTGKVPPLVTLRLLLRALKVRDVDEILDELTDDDGNFIDPAASAGQAAADALRAGKVPLE